MQLIGPGLPDSLGDGDFSTAAARNMARRRPGSVQIFTDTELQVRHIKPPRQKRVTRDALQQINAARGRVNQRAAGCAERDMRGRSQPIDVALVHHCLELAALAGHRVVSGQAGKFILKRGRCWHRQITSGDQFIQRGDDLELQGANGVGNAFQRNRMTMGKNT